MVFDSRRQGGISLLDLMVAIAIIALLLGLIVPAMLSSRGGFSIRVECASNMRQVGLALIQYMNMHTIFPNAGTYGESPDAFAESGPNASKSAINDLFDGRGIGASYIPGGAEGGADVGPLHSWVLDVLPYLEAQELHNAWNWDRVYTDTGVPGATYSNALISNTHIRILTCPEDDTVKPAQGNLSFVVNSGFSAWPAFYSGSAGLKAPGWIGTDGSRAPHYGQSLDLPSSALKKFGVMFLGTHTGKAPWDVRTTPGSIVDGFSCTLLLSENVRAGYSATNAYTGPYVKFVSWAAPHPNFTMFLTSDNICGGRNHATPGNGACQSDGGLAPRNATEDGPSWRDANRQGNFENLNYGLSLKDEGSFPYPTSRHFGGVNTVMCDGSARFIRDTIDGTVWAKLVTPAGSQLPAAFSQLPVDASDYDQ